MKPSEWVIKVLDRYDLHKPDGRPLYQFRISDEEFTELTDLLKLSSHFGVENTTRMFLWDAAFVFYAAEWWRRHYSGQWGWDGIFDSISLDNNDLTAIRRNTLIETGLLRWRRKVRTHDGTRKFLGTIATEGGLPLHQLADSGGWLKTILKPVITKHVSRDIPVSTLVDKYQELIPRSYRTTELNQILIEIVETVVKLKHDHQLMYKDTPIEWLDNNQPTWRELFPLPIDDSAGESLLSDLVDTASKTTVAPNDKNPFEVERYLVRAETKDPGLIVKLDLPSFVFLDSINLKNEDNSLPSRLDIEVYSPDGSVWPWCQAILTNYKERQALKLSGKSFKVTNVDATKELSLRFKYVGEVVHEMPLLNGEGLDVDLPWLFKCIDDQWMFYGEASQSVKSDSAIVYVPSNYACVLQGDDDSINEYSHIFSGSILKISGTVNCISEDVKYKLSAGVEDTLFQYHLSGERYKGMSNPGQVFIGKPDLIETNLVTDKLYKVNIERLLVKPLGVNVPWKPISQVKSGNVEARVLDEEGNIKLRKRIALLDDEFSYQLIADRDNVNAGEILLSGVENYDISICSTNLSSSVKKCDKDSLVKLCSDTQPPLTVDIALLKKSNNREIVLTFPYPSKGALLFDAEGKQVLFNTHLYLDKLQGYRIKIYSDKHVSSRSGNLRFTLIDSALTSEMSNDLYVRRKIYLKSGVVEFSIYDWYEVIDSLMSVSTSLDSHVKISLVNQGQEEFCFNIYRYENELSAIWDEGVVQFDNDVLRGISNDQLVGTEISSLFLNQPEQACIALNAITSDGVATGQWSFSPEKRQTGPWMIYPLGTSEIKFRTLLWNVGELVEADDISEMDTLPKAILISDQIIRENAIRKVLNLMANDISHKSWLYLRSLWEKTSHLAMITFDVWKIAISETRFIASLFVQEDEAIINKMEIELPLIWELVRLSDWENALILYKNKILNNLGDDEDQLIRELLESKICKIETLGVSMKSAAEILRYKLFDEQSQGLKAMELPVDVLLKPQLDAVFQDLLRRQSEADWPETLTSHIKANCERLPKELLVLLNTQNTFQFPIVFLPLFLAWRSIYDLDSDWPQSPSDIFKIQQLKLFDEDWFSAVYQLLSGWLSMQNNLGNK